MLEPGTVVAGFRVDRVIGEGGMACVYRATQLSLRRPVALKVLSLRLQADDRFRERFKREGEAQAKLDHPNIVEVYDTGESEHGLYLAMRLVEGPTLRELLADGPLSPGEALAILTPIASGLDAAHAKGLVHRDITPQNILIADGGRPFLSDFGISRNQGDRTLTRTNELIATSDYVSPEQVKGLPADARSDIYAFSAVLFESLSGLPPFADRESQASILYAHAFEQPPSVSSSGQGLPSEIDRVLAKGLEKDPDQRFESARDLVEAAAEALDVEIEVKPGPQPRPPRDPARTRTGLGPPIRERQLPEPTTEPTGDAPAPGRRRRAVGFALGSITLAAIAFAASLVVHGASGESLDRRLSAGPLRLDYPNDWERDHTRPVAGLSLGDEATVGPTGEAGGVLAGLTRAVGPTLLPRAFRDEAQGRLRRERVSLGEMEAYRYRAVRLAGESGLLTIVVVPTRRGVATIVCRQPHGAVEVRSLCGPIAASASLGGVAPLPLGPDSGLSARIRRQLGVLSRGRRKLRRALAGAATPEAQSRASRMLAARFGNAESNLRHTRTGPESQEALRALVVSLRSARLGYATLAAAIGQQDPAAYESASARVREAERAVNRRLIGLESLGYRVRR